MMNVSVLEPPTVSAYDRLRRHRNWWAVAAIVLAWWLGVSLFFQLRDNYGAGGVSKSEAGSRKPEVGSGK